MLFSDRWEYLLLSFQVLTAMNMKTTFFRDVAPCSLVKVYVSIRTIFMSTQHSIPEDILKLIASVCLQYMNDVAKPSGLQIQTFYHT